MKKSIFLILVLVLIIPSMAYSAAVTRTTAEQVAMNWYSERNNKASGEFIIVESFIEMENTENIFFIFNFDKIGFVIVSADDIAVPILGYVFEHNYTSENHPPQFDAMLASFREQILYARENNLSPPQETVDKWNRLKVTADMFVPENFRAVGPLLSTTWNQGLYYNESCPADGASTAGNGYVWAGCTATATAQVMKYHAHPVTGEGSHSYTDATYGLQSVNFGATTYNWALMPNNVLAVNPFVHTLLYHVGVGAEMQYGATGSGAWIGGVHPATALSALQNHFKYDPNSYYDQRNNYSATPSVWHSMLKTELDNNRPLVYEGYNSGWSDGHAFVIDGYSGLSNDNYHVNWGWSGGYNGYYTLDALAPVLPSYDYRFYQAALFGVEPRKWKPLPDVSINVSSLPYTGVDLDDYYEGPVASLSYSVVTDLTGQEFALTINGNNELYFTASPSVTSNVNIDITIRATYTGGTADDTFNFIITVASANYDWGDAPDPTYPTLATSTGAYHQIVAGIQLGNTIDSEPDGQPNSTATGDDIDGNNDDDGVVFNSALIPGSTAAVTITASVPGILEGWIDFDGNGSWADSGEQIITNVSVPAGSTIHNFTVPISSITGSTYARFRFCTQGATVFFGQAPDGEVEDYQITIGEESSTKWEQLPDLSLTGMDVDATFKPAAPDNMLLLADDFLCSETGYITDIHIWGSWINDYIPFSEDPAAVQIKFSIHSDIPDPDGPGPEYSMPGDMLWMSIWIPGPDDVEMVYEGPEDWYNPALPMWINDNHIKCYKYNYILDPLDYFLQEGTIDEPIVYWLDVQALPMDDNAECRFGWKTSLDHWNDDAVWVVAEEPYTGIWNELIYPDGHEFETESIDLAFQITTEGEPTEEYDFGDAPEGQTAIAYPSTGVTGAFPTCITVGTASSYIQHGTGENLAWFGPMVDLETDGNAGLCPGCFSTYDDDECFNDGDAGLIMPGSYTIDASDTVIPCPGVTAGSSLGVICQNATWGVDIDIDVKNYMAVDGYINVLFDWNQDGQWQNNSATHCSGVLTPEHVLADFPVPAGHMGPLSSLMAIGTSFQIGPNDGYVWVRFSITEVPVGTSDWNGDGVFEDGETEDYLLYVEGEPEELDFGDAPDPAGAMMYPTTLANNGARHVIDYQIYMGISIDSELDGQPDATATGDDNDGNDDEDGVHFTSILVQGYTTYVVVNASVDGFLNAWVDFNINGSWADTLEQIFSDVSLVAGDNNLSFSVPAGAVPGPTFTRFRFDTTGGLTYTGQANNGEVEDYQVAIHEPIEDSKMHFPQWPDPSGWDVNCTEPNIIADDWTCIESGPVTDIHFWVSWFTGDGTSGLIDSIHISIHANIPAGTLPYSKPGNLLWQMNFKQGEFGYEEFWDYGLQGWYDPHSVPQQVIPDDHDYFDLINITNIPDPFNQQEGTIYWLDVKIFMDPDNSSYKLGWKTSQHHWEDIAVYFNGSDWIPLYDPITQEPFDMAFVITGSEQPVELDFGDAPDDTLGTGYSTLLINDGARHIIDYAIYMGDSIDAEPNGQPNSTATGDDDNILYPGVVDDEDGVTFTSILVPGYTTYVTVNASVDGFLNAWVDFNGNGFWDPDPAEKIFNDVSLVAGDNDLSFSVPASAVVCTTFARFRFDTIGGLTYSGLAPNGEVEDYQVVIHDSIPNSKMHYPQWPDPTGWDIKFQPPNVIADDWQCIESGPVTDVHFWISYQGDIEPDPFPGIDSIHLSIHDDFEIYPGMSQPGNLLWHDNYYTNDFSISGPFFGDQGWFVRDTWSYIQNDHTKFYRIDIENIQDPFVQCQDSIYWLDIYVALEEPDLYQVGWKTSGVEHFRKNAMYGWFHASGGWEWDEIVHPITEESLDMAFVITGEPGDLDFGDAPDPAGAMMYPTTLANNGARHVIDYITFLGDTIDAEADGWQSSDALGDDTHDLDDEDGVTFNSSLIPGGSTEVTVIASVDGVLNAWVDFNCNNDWGDPGEQIFNDTALSSGTNTLIFNVPAGAVKDSTFARFRFNLIGNLDYEGLACKGEVEDYLVVIEEALDFGDAPDPLYPTLLAHNGARHVIDYVTFLGDTIDAEADGWQSADALGDDIHYLDDEDGVVFKPIITGSPAQVIVTTSAPGYLQGWMDFNQDGDWIDSGEQIFADAYVHFASTVCLNYYVPATADTGYTFARFRFSTIPGLADSGLAADGEVEDYKVHIVDVSDVKWLQLPCEELPGLHCHDEFINRHDATIIADDWLCNGGLVTDIHWWGNYEHVNQGIDHFHLSIHANDPTGSCLPLDPEIWDVDVPFSDAYETSTGLYNSEGNAIYSYEYYLTEPFEQTEGEFYWLDICAYSVDPNPPNNVIWRWQESARSTSPILCPASSKTLYLPWLNIIWTSIDPYRYSDMAFAITSEELPAIDYGDAPDPTYPTLLASNGARHALDGVTYLGNLTDGEADGWQSITALGDDNHNLDDEDGVIFTCPLIPGEQGAITVTTNSSGVAFFNSWIDFNADGDWSDANEQIFTDLPLSAGIKPLNFNVPIGATIDSTYARFRFCTVAGIADTGYAPDGEVEDYKIEISEVPDDDCKMHYHQWPDTTWYGMDVRATEPIILADDFLCIEDGLINSIHIWGSWLFDMVMPPAFYLSIWSDNPDGPGGFSQPELEFWGRYFGYGDYIESLYTTTNGEFWYDPTSQLLLPFADLMIWQYDFTIPDSEAFVQEVGTTYWLSMTVMGLPPDPNIGFGWKTSVNHWNDDAVWSLGYAKDRLTWNELRYPDGHPFHPYSIDFSFYINCEPSTPIVNISVSSDTVYVTWDPIPCADSYTVYSSLDPYAPFPSGWTVEQTGIITPSWCENASGTTKKFYKVVAVK